MNQALRRCGAVTALLALFALHSFPAEASVPSKEVWLSDVDSAMAGSHRYLDRRVERGGNRLAVNFDIDNTTLATHYDPGHPVARVLRFARHADQLGVEVLFNTARLRGGGRMRAARNQLEAAGYKVTAICGRMPGERLADSKTRCRQLFVGAGYTLIANVGNRETDCVGGYYERAYRLPNYDNQLS